MWDRVWAAEHLVDANRVEMRHLPFRHINCRKEETEPFSACIDRDYERDGDKLTEPCIICRDGGRREAVSPGPFTDNAPDPAIGDTLSTPAGRTLAARSVPRGDRDRPIHGTTDHREARTTARSTTACPRSVSPGAASSTPSASIAPARP